jgi:hypothetical protein
MSKGGNIKFNLSIDFLKQGKSVVAYSPALDISTVGKDKREAKNRFEELVSIFFEEVSETGNLNEVLKELGWKKAKSSWKPPKIVSSKPIAFNLPVKV